MSTRKPKPMAGRIEPQDPEAIKGGRAARAQVEAEEAFDRSGGYTFKGETLKPFSLERQLAAQRLGLRYGTLSPGEVKRVPIEIPGTGKEKVKTYYLNYAGMLEDCVLVLYLCTLEPEEIVMIRGEEREARFHLKAAQWAESKGIGYLNEAHGEAYTLFRIMMSDIRKTEVTVDPSQRGAASGAGSGN